MHLFNRTLIVFSYSGEMQQLPISDQLKKNLQKAISTEPLFKKLKILSFEQQKK